MARGRWSVRLLFADTDAIPTHRLESTLADATVLLKLDNFHNTRICSGTMPRIWSAKAWPRWPRRCVRRFRFMSASFGLLVW